MGRFIVLVVQFMRKNWKVVIGSMGSILTLAAGWRLKAGKEKLMKEQQDKEDLKKQLLLDIEDAKDEDKDSADKFISYFSD